MMSAFPLSPLSPSFSFNSSNNLKRRQTGANTVRSQNSFLPFDIPQPIAEAFDLPSPTTMDSKSGRQSKVERHGKEESFSPFSAERGGRFGFGFRSGEKSRTMKKTKRGTMVLPILPPPPSAPPIKSRTIIPAESMDSLQSAFSGRSDIPKPSKRFDINREQTTRFGYKPSNSHTSSYSSTSNPNTAGHLSTQHSYTSSVSAGPSVPLPTNQYSPSEDDKAIAALERLSHHILAENKIPGFKPLPLSREDAYERTRAVPRQRKESVQALGLDKEGYVVVPRPKGKEAAKGLSYVKASERRYPEAEEKETNRDSIPASTAQSASLRGWKMIRPISSSGKKDRPVSDGLPPSHRRTISRAIPTPAPTETALPPVPTLSRDNVEIKSLSRSRINKGLVRMRSISSTRLTSPDPINPTHTAASLALIDPAPPIPPRAASRPQAIRRASANSCTTLLTVQTGMHVPIVLSPGRDVKEGVPRGAVRDSLTSMTGTEVDLLSPRHTPIQLGPLPPLPTPSKIPLPSGPTRKNSLLAPQTRLSQLRIKRNTPTIASSGSVGHGSEESGTTADSIAEEGMRVLEEVRRREKLIPRDEPRLRSARGDDYPIRERKGDREGSETRGGMTAFSFLSLFEGEDLDISQSGLTTDLSDPRELLNAGRASSEAMCHDRPSHPHPLAAGAETRTVRSMSTGEHARPITPLISHIIPPEERSRIGTSLPRPSRNNRESVSDSISSLEGPLESISQMRDIFFDNPSAEEGELPNHLNSSFTTSTSTSHSIGRTDTTPRRPKPPLSLQPLSPLYESTGPLTALSPPPRSRKMTTRAGSVPGCSLGLGIGQPSALGQEASSGLSISQVQASRSFSLGAEIGSGRSNPRMGRSVSHGAGYNVGEGAGEEAILVYGKESPTLVYDRISPSADLTPFGPTRKDLLASLAQAQADTPRQFLSPATSKDKGEEDDGVEPLLRQAVRQLGSLEVYPDSPTMPISHIAPFNEFGGGERSSQGPDVSQEGYHEWKEGSWSSSGNGQVEGQGQGEYGHLRYFRAVMG